MSALSASFTVSTTSLQGGNLARRSCQSQAKFNGSSKPPRPTKTSANVS